jgi:hypothetical protein
MTEPRIPGVAGRLRGRALIAWPATVAVVVVGATLNSLVSGWCRLSVGGSAESNDGPALTARYSLFQRNDEHGGIEGARRDAATRISGFQGSQGYTRCGHTGEWNRRRGENHRPRKPGDSRRSRFKPLPRRPLARCSRSRRGCASGRRTLKRG